jgi:hypothetical protein
MRKRWRETHPLLFLMWNNCFRWANNGLWRRKRKKYIKRQQKILKINPNSEFYFIEYQQKGGRPEGKKVPIDLGHGNWGDHKENAFCSKVKT